MLFIKRRYFVVVSRLLFFYIGLFNLKDLFKCIKLFSCTLFNLGGVDFYNYLNIESAFSRAFYSPIP